MTDSSLERRAEEQVKEVFDRAQSTDPEVWPLHNEVELARTIEQLLSENRQVLKRANAHELGQFDLRRELEAAEAEVRQKNYDLDERDRELEAAEARVKELETQIDMCSGSCRL